MKCRLLICLVAMLFQPALAAAFSGGVTGMSGKQGADTNCNQCHSGGVPPTVRFEGPSQVEPGTIATFRFVVESGSPQQTHAGFNVASSSGVLNVVPNQGARKPSNSDEITHSSPKENLAGVAAWDLTWEAPSLAGTATLYGSGNSVNRNFNTSGDAAASTTFEITVGGPLPSPTAAEPPTPTATETTPPTATATASSTDTPTPLETCPGDCNGDGEVTVDELVRGVSIALGLLSLESCAASDTNRNGEVAVDELIRAVNAALSGCP